ncbi:hypothetical protein WN51_12905 [Melipona quadrifasciata]|uniref:Uncharacterized protein n=1 Tax=Melipona quadrifasciata TaxID=166423 RepID=A0A0N0BKF4_9HYME|nr:hypothetical protein WN51_12905 [Melipona quadrifasciata]
MTSDELGGRGSGSGTVVRLARPEEGDLVGEYDQTNKGRRRISDMRENVEQIDKSKWEAFVPDIKNLTLLKMNIVIVFVQQEEEKRIYPFMLDKNSLDGTVIRMKINGRVKRIEMKNFSVTQAIKCASTSKLTCSRLAFIETPCAGDRNSKVQARLRVMQIGLKAERAVFTNARGSLSSSSAAFRSRGALSSSLSPPHLAGESTLLSTFSSRDTQVRATRGKRGRRSEGVVVEKKKKRKEKEEKKKEKKKKKGVTNAVNRRTGTAEFAQEAMKHVKGMMDVSA